VNKIIEKYSIVKTAKKDKTSFMEGIRMPGKE